MKFRRLVCGIALLTAITLSPGHAQQLFPSFKTPSFRGSAGTAEYTRWDIFSEAYNEPNFGDSGTAAASNPTLTQILTESAFITSGFNIYSFADATGFEIANNVSATLAAPLTNVVFQFDTLGTATDFATIRLNYNGGASSLAPTNFITESRVITGGMGGFTNRSAMQWNLTGLGVTNYTITFASLGSSSSFNIGVLDTSKNAFTEVVASARTWDAGAGDGRWSSPANWSGDSVTTVGGNVNFGSVTGATVQLDGSREVGLLTVTKPGAFHLTATAGTVLTINTGITANAGGSGTQTLATPIFLGGHNFMDVATGTTLELSGVISGSGEIPVAGGFGSYPATGLYKQGGGTLLLLGNNTFTGGFTVDGGTVIVSGANQYTGSTGIFEGALVLRGPAPSGRAGTLGNGASNVAVGFDPGTSSGFPAAQVVIDGNFIVGRNFSLAAGTLSKVLGARHATGAIYSGSISLATTSDHVFLRAEAAADVVTFSGAITGGGSGRTLTKDGAGTVLFSGADKAYSNATAVAAGTLEIAINTALIGNGNVTVASGAKLLVHGSLSGTGSLAASGGTIGGSGMIYRAFTLDGGDTLAPGAGVGTLTTVGQTWADGGRFQLELSDADAAPGTGWDAVNLVGGLDLAASAGGFTLELRTLTASGAAGLMQDFNATQNYLWKFAGATDGLTNFAASDFTIDATGFQNALNRGSFHVAQSGNDLVLRFQAVPEPSFALLLASGAPLFTRRRLRFAQ